MYMSTGLKNQRQSFKSSFALRVFDFREYHSAIPDPVAWPALASRSRRSAPWSAISTMEPTLAEWRPYLSGLRPTAYSASRT